MKAESLKGHLDGMLLAILAGGPAHGYAIIEELRRRSGGALDLPEGTVYPALHRLERARLLKSAWSKDAPRRRRVYTLTARGKRAVGREHAAWSEFRESVERVWGGAPA
jgi:DNA-binding PadR family transcriptional regulator